MPHESDDLTQPGLRSDENIDATAIATGDQDSVIEQGETTTPDEPTP